MTAARTVAPVVPVAVPYAESAAALPFPGDDPTALDGVANRLLDAAQHLARLDDVLFDAATAVAGAWRGTAATTGQAEMETIRAALDQGSDRLYRARAALLDLQDELTVIRAAVEAARAGWLRAEGDVRALQLAIRLSDCATVAPLQEALRLATVRRDTATTSWSDAVRRADVATAVCASALTATVSGAPVYRAGRGAVTADLGETLGTDRMTSDDAFRSVLDRTPDSEAAWASLGPAAQAFARTTAGTLPPPSSAPALVAAWWSSRSWTERQAVLHDAPQAVGAADGVSAVSRHQANLLSIERRDAELGSLIAAASTAGFSSSVLVRSAVVAGLQQHRDSIAAVRAQLATPRSQPLYLLSFDSAGRGRAVVAIGDPDTAAHVATYVPGTGSDVSSLGAELDRADAWSAGTAEFGTRDVAAIAWIGYESPPGLTAAGHDSYADAAAPALVAFQQGLRASHQGPPAHTTVVGHSYGNSAIAAAASEGRSLAADRLVLVASTGLELSSVADLHLDGVAPDRVSDRVFALVRENDIIRWTEPVHRGSPYEPGFGARVIETEPFRLIPGSADLGLAGIRSPALDGLWAHGAYQAPGSMEQRTISALIVDAPVPLR